MPLVLTPRTAGRDPLAIELVGIVPDRVASLDLADVARLPIRADARPIPLGELFSLAGDPGDGRIECRGDFARVHGIGAGMQWGAIEVTGDAGRHAGEGMAGGTLRVAGAAGDWLAAEMTGGEVAVAGDAGDNVAGALPGSDLGMRGGLVTVGGRVGRLAGARMRRGILAVGGDCGAAAAFELRAGTVLVGGRVGDHPALGMRRGSLVACGSVPPIPPGFLPGAVWFPGFLGILFARLSRAGFACRPGLAAAPWRQWHGDPLTGCRGEILAPA